MCHYFFFLINTSLSNYAFAWDRILEHINIRRYSLISITNKIYYINLHVFYLCLFCNTKFAQKLCNLHSVVINLSILISMFIHIYRFFPVLIFNMHLLEALPFMVTLKAPMSYYYIMNLVFYFSCFDFIGLMVSTDIYVLTVKLKPLVLLLYLWKKILLNPLNYQQSSTSLLTYKTGYFTPLSLENCLNI